MEDISEFESCQKIVGSQCADIGKFLGSIQDMIQDDDWKAETGVSLLDVKNHQMLDYLINLVLVMLAKMKGQSIVGNPAIERLVELRTVVERMRPIEQKMQYQIEKLISAATSGAEKNESMKHRPRPEDLVGEDGSDSEGSEEGEDGKDSRKKKAKKYLPPKLLAVPYDDEDKPDATGSKDKDDVEGFRMKKSMMYELQQQYSGAPEEVFDASEQRRRKELEKQRKQIEYEEENMVRLQMGKKERMADKKKKAHSTLDSLLDMDSFESSDRKRRKSTGTHGRKNSVRGKGKKQKRRSHH